MTDSGEYHFVIIGGGTAGLVVATRLSEDPSQRVLVLEAGADLSDDPRIKTPAHHPALLGSQADWNFKSEPQLSLNGRSVNLYQGKALGGSSAINAQIFVPPTNASLDAWGTLGNDGWNWDTMKEYYSKAFKPPVIDQSSRKVLGIDGYSPYDTPNGPLQLSYAGNPEHPVREAWMTTFKNKGYHVSNDPFLGISVGAFTSLSSVDPARKERSYATSAYYNPVKYRTNLKVLTNATVERILFKDGHRTKAIGVQYRHGDNVQAVAAIKEVILAAGVLQSPKLLELSGIGNKSILRNNSIEIVQDLPGVGENLYDHPVCSISYEVAEGIETLDSVLRQEPEALEKAMQDYTVDQIGLLASMGVNTYAYLPMVDYLSEKGQEEIKQLLAQHRPCGNGPSENRERSYYEFAEKILLDSNQPSAAYCSLIRQHPLPVDPNSDSPSGPIPGNFIALVATLSQPLSRGSVHIASNDPLAAPTIDLNYFSNEIDIEVYARHMLYLDTIAKSSPFSKLLKQPLVRRDPASHLTDIETAKKYLRTSTISMWHMGGTCAMLPEEKGGVVNPKLKVYGVDSLRIVDASAIPLNSTANMQSTVYAFAERAADLIKQDYGL
ncbi:GMC oxidoreductase [Daldinia decipiens]|uniref:GMC oxidoreductase n=1 Tax=Daldinia decipiens TaxID=326647 RepID=UPI0020C27DE4|nr:GMC oxidoreductase [Daldinia decipiens]KAI1662906.1 GMC oxidoreductase [Daldinia decipiens]